MKCCLLFIIVYGFSAVTSFDSASDKFFKLRRKTVYFLEPDPKFTWHQALEECQAKNMSLLSVETRAKNTEIKNLLLRLYRGSSSPTFYIGANDLNEFRKFLWSSNGQSLEYTNWYSDEPNNHDELNERCVNIGYYGNEQWNDVNCSYRCGFICEKTLILKGGKWNEN